MLNLRATSGRRSWTSVAKSFAEMPRGFLIQRRDDVGHDDAGLEGVSSSSSVEGEKSPETRDLRMFGLNGNAAAAAAVAFQVKHESKLRTMKDVDDDCIV